MLVKKVGRIKWFNVAKFFGYIQCEDGEPDIRIHGSILRKASVKALYEGARIECLAECDGRGVWNAMHVLSLDTSAVATLETKPRVAAETDWMPAKVKWLCSRKAYGFVVCPPPWGDAFFHVEDLERCRIYGVTPGQQVLVKCGRRRRGAAVADMRLVAAG